MMNVIRISILNGIKDLIKDLKNYTDVLPFEGTNGTVARGKKAGSDKQYNWRWPGIMRGYGPITRLYDWEK
jgi:hypothetical protein